MTMDREMRSGLWLFGGILFYFLPLVVYAWGYFRGMRGESLHRLGMGSAFVLWIIGQWMIVRSKRVGSKTAEEALGSDPRPPVLYLRSFRADRFDELRRTANLILRSKDGVPPSREEELTDLLQKAGPVIALGRPGERLPQLGASRIYVSDDRWQATVQDYLARSTLVVIRAGKTPGLRWELTEIVKRVSPHKVMIWLPRKRDYAAFHIWANEVLPRPLPEVWPIDTVVFSEDWEPALPLADWWRQHGIAIDGQGRSA